MESLTFGLLLCFTWTMTILVCPSTADRATGKGGGEPLEDINALTWSERKAVIDFVSEVKVGLGGVAHLYDLTYGDPCDPTDETNRTALITKIVGNLESIYSVANVNETLSALRVDLKALIEWPGHSCNISRYFVCTPQKTCACLQNQAAGVNLQWEEDGFCRIAYGSGCRTIDIFQAGKFNDTRPKTVARESNKCAGAVTCIIRDNGQKCTIRNVQKESKRILEDFLDNNNKDELQKRNEEWEKRRNALGYCVCEGVRSELQSHVFGFILVIWFVMTIKV